MKKTKNTTILDVAKQAKVSTGTVDRVINNRGSVSPLKRKMVEEAIKQLDFNPNMLARALALKKKTLICSLFPEAKTAQNYWSLPKRGIEQGADSFRDYGFVQASFEYSSFDETSFVKQAKAILSKNPSGVILAPLFEKESIAFIHELDDKNIPYVFIDANIPNQKNLSYIGPDSKRSGFIAAKLLHATLQPQEHILIINMVKGIENNSHIGVINDGFHEYYESIKRNENVFSLTIHSADEADIARELSKYYNENIGIKGVFVTNSKAHLISKFHRDNGLTIKVIGFDLVAKNIAEVANGGIDFIISQSPVLQGVQAVQTLFDFFVYKKEPAITQYYVPLDIIIKENVDYYLSSR